MALDFVSIGIAFGPVTGSTHEAIYPLEFDRKVLRVAIALSGFSAQFDNADHELHLLQFDTDYRIIEETKVIITVNFLLRDYSGNIDDSYSGEVWLNVFYDLSSIALPPVHLSPESGKNAPL
jgi:hypothetical protein